MMVANIGSNLMDNVTSTKSIAVQRHHVSERTCLDIIRLLFAPM